MQIGRREGARERLATATRSGSVMADDEGNKHEEDDDYAEPRTADGGTVGW